MPEWEYIKLDLNAPPRDKDDVDLLNEAGKAGWELVTIQHGIAYLKRPVRAATTARSARRKSEGGEA